MNSSNNLFKQAGSLLFVLLLLLAQNVQAQYSETFSTPNKGYLTGNANDFSGVNWTLSNWPAASRDANDFFSTSSGGQLIAADLDSEVCWESPLLSIGGAVNITCLLGWNNFDSDVAGNPCNVNDVDHITASYSLNGQGYQEVSNLAGGATCATIGYSAAAGALNLSSSGNLVIPTLPGSTLKIRICGAVNEDDESFVIDNVVVANATIHPCQPMPPVAGSDTWVGCNSTNWNDGLNWLDGTVPTAAENVTIPDVANDPTISTAAVAKSVTVQSGALLTIAAAGSLTINGSSTQGILNQGTIDNNGTINVGGTTSVGSNGIRNLGTFNNKTGSTISINRSTGAGLYNAGTVTNNATINIGSTASVGVFGLDNTGTFNHNSGVVNIDNCTFAGLRQNTTGSFSNLASIVIGANTSVGDYGLIVYNYFLNAGNIQIDRSTFAGLLPNQSTCNFQNQGVVTIGANASVGSYSIFNSNSGSVTNQACGQFRLYASYNQQPSASFTNNGLLWINTTAAHSNGNVLTNNGVIDYVQNTTIPNVVNNEIVVAPISGGCSISPALSLGAMVDFSIGTTWFLNANLTQPVGTYTQATNTLAVTNLAEGTHTLYFAVTDNANGCTRTVSIKVNYDDVTPPTITCQSNVTINVNANCQGVIGLYTLTGSDNCSLSLGYTQNPGSGTVISGHNTVQVVTLTASDDAGNTASCPVTVTLKDVTPPSVTCPTNATVALNASCQAQLGTFSAATLADNCNSSPTVTQSPAASTLLTGHNATQTVTLTANDGNGNTSTCSFVVTAKDVTPPTVTCQSNVTINASANCQGTLGLYSLTGSDNCSPSLGYTQNPGSGTTISGHNTVQVVTLTASDAAGNSTSCPVTVTLKDVTPPSVTCPANATVALNASCQAQLGTFSAATLADNCNPSPTVTQSPASSTLLTGHNATQTVTLTANDGNGNTATCSFVVTGKDVAPPSISCPANSTVALNASCQSAVGVYSAATLADNCNPSPAVTQSPASSTLLTGHNSTQTVTLTANDGNGNTASCSFVVTGKDVTPPSVTCKPATVNLSAAGTGSVTTANVFNSGSDNCGTVNQVSVTPNSFTCSNLGANTVTLTVNDGNGNTTTCSATVTVNDVTAPTVVCKPATVNLSAAGTGSVTTSAVFNSGSDNCGTVNQVGVSPNSFTCTNLGSNTVTLTVNDGHGNTATCSATVTVNDVTPPSVTCKPATVNLSAAGTGSVTAADVFQSGSDNCGTVNPVSVSPNSFTCSNLGENTVTLTVNDGHGNTATCSATVTVNDVTPPTVTCKSDVTLALDGDGTASIYGIDLVVLAETYDNCGFIDVDGVSSQFFTCANLGLNYATVLVNDGHGNTATCQATVTVFDHILPSVECPDNLTVTSTTFDCAANVDFSVSGQDNCGIDFIEYSHEPGSEFSGGSTLVEVTVFDAANNEAGCSFWIFVEAAPEVCDGVDNDCDGLIDEPGDFEPVSKQADAASGQFDQFGNAVALDDNTALVGIQLDDEKGFNAGAAQLYTRNSSGQWTATKRLYAADAASDDQFGHAVAVVGDWALVAANFRDDNGINSGAVYVFGRNSGGTNQWGQVAKLQADDASSNQNFGAALDFDGRFALVGANLDDAQAANAGAAYVFDAQDNWAQVAKLTALDGTADDDFGAAVAIDNQEFAVVGASANDAQGDQAGAAYLYRRNATDGTWALVKKLTSSATAAGDRFGWSVALAGNTAVVGAPRNDYRTANGGVAYVFDRNAGGLNNWGAGSRLFAYDSEAGDQLGRTVAVDGGLAAVGAPFEDAKGFGAGAVYTYLRLPDGGWIFSEKIVDPTGNLNDNFASALALSGRTILVGTPRDDEQNVADNGSVQWFEAACSDDTNLTTPNEGSIQVPVVQQLTGGLQVFPVPFSSELNVSLNLPSVAPKARLTVCNTLGQVVATLHEGTLDAGAHLLRWTPASHLPAGTYFVRIDAGAVQEVRSVVRVE